MMFHSYLPLPKAANGSQVLRDVVQGFLDQSSLGGSDVSRGGFLSHGGYPRNGWFIKFIIKNPSING